MKWIVAIVAIALLVIGGSAVYAAGGWRTNANTGETSPAGLTRGTYHKQMETIMESGSFADLEALRAETGRPLKPWVVDEATFAQAREQHEQMVAQYGEGPHYGEYGARDGSGQGKRQGGRGGCMRE